MISIVSLHELITDGLTKEEFNKSIVKDFRCPKNLDVESFLIEKSFDSCSRDFTRTYFIVDNDESKEFYESVIAYFTITNKKFDFAEEASGSLKNKLTGSRKAESLYTILIAQLGKNDNYSGVEISGKQILSEAETKCIEVYDIIGTKIIALEHHDDEKLHNFYEENNYALLDHASDKENNLQLRYKKIDKVLIEENLSYKTTY
ncbi:hypothetical protein [Macrococcoides canis]|uniref:Uncharacterized protein n=1 Tax=Macrococcoides canis TaxID=1855823 RepID=A0AAE6X3E6_9STAP|nr:hypothetical protein [Macrococcus canis]MCO4096902.1 hypothetical protein [Macrococcus canis]QIH79052.1 hypothetical protein GTN30_10385 [Macrococcus canis]QNR08586.1 hypothetical protein GL258_10180 [Macrococcus canis]UTH08787.1 hypothetical protein KFV08_09895 [Macrococcus canis]